MSNAKDIVWISSYPKSGNTWLQNIVRSAGANHGFPDGEMDVYTLLDKSIEPSPCYCLNKKLSASGGFVLKTHASFEKVHQKIFNYDLNLVGFLHVYRNPFDMLLSYINYTRIEYSNYRYSEDYQVFLFKLLMGFDKVYSYDEWRNMKLEDIPTINLDHALNFFSRNNLSLPVNYSMASGWYENIMSWKSKESSTEGCLIKYEELFDDFKEIETICNIFSFQVDDFLKAKYDFNMKINQVRMESSDGSIFYNKMRKSYFKDFYSKSVIDEFIKNHESNLFKLGYLNLEFV